MYALSLALHNLLRWAVLLAGLYALFRMLRGLSATATWTPSDRRATVIFTTLLHVQLLIGLIVYGTSTLTRSAMADMGAAMRDPAVRWFVAEHPVIMVLAAVVATIGSVMARKAPTDGARFRRGAIAVAVALALVAYGIPWDRPALRGM